MRESTPAERTQSSFTRDRVTLAGKVRRECGKSTRRRRADRIRIWTSPEPAEPADSRMGSSGVGNGRPRSPARAPPRAGFLVAYVIAQRLTREDVDRNSLVRSSELRQQQPNLVAVGGSRA